jgi:GTP-binding protein
LHLVDAAPLDGSDPVEAVQVITHELEKFSPELAKKERWLVFNKVDLLPEKDANKICSKIVKRLKWSGPVFKISALKKIGTEELCYKLMDYFKKP